MALAGGLVSCASYTTKTKAVVDNFRGGHYSQALTELDKSDTKSSEPLLYLLEKSMILDRLGEFGPSRSALKDADRLVDERYTTSISKEAISYVYNDSAQDYPGEDYEKVAIHIMMALSFLEDGDMDAAAVEARRINTRLNEINGFYKDNKNKYTEDAFGRYLAGLIHEAKGDYDSAIVDYKLSLKAYKTEYKAFFEVRNPPGDLITALYNLLIKRDRKQEALRLKANYPRQVAKASMPDRGYGELIVIHQLGLIARKQEYSYLVNLGREIQRFSFPKIYPMNPYRFGRTGVRVANKPFTPAQLVQNFDGIAARTLEDRRVRLVAKQAARLILKSQINQKARQELGPLGGLLTNIFNAATETADTRAWALLPSAFYVTRYALTPGKHSVTLYHNGRMDGAKSVKVGPGSKTFLVTKGQ
jgi:hypothetical protein